MSDARQSPLARLGWIINVCFDQVGTVFFGVLIIATIKQKWVIIKKLKLW